MAPALQSIEIDTPSNPKEDEGPTSTGAPSILSVKSSSSSTASSIKSGSGSTKTGSTSRSKSSTSSVPKSANWKQATDPLGMSSKAVGPGFMPMFNTHLYAPGFQTSGGTNTSGGVPKAYQSKQLKFVEKKQTGSSAASTISRKSSKSNHSSGSSTKSSFFSSLAGSIFNPNESVNNKSTVSTEGTEAGPVDEDHSKNNKSEEPTQEKEPEDTIQPGLEKEVVLTTGELTIVVEDHSSDSPSDATVHRVDSLSPGQVGILRRPSIADLISQFQLPSSPQHPVHPPNELLLKRVTSWEYLGWVHHGKMAYFNTILLTEADLRKFYTPELVQKRTHQFFLLGTAIGNALEIPHTADFARTLNAIVHEYEHFLSADSKLKMQNLFRTGRKALAFEETDEYTHFEVRTVPFEMDYTVVFATLCEIVALAYKKFDTHQANIITNSEVFYKIDVRLKKILNNATRELEAMAREAMQEELNSIDPISSIMMDWDL
ncbi:MAG: hypothetical protein J3Q66DRAFT_335283 [Benniella sp.]|nr:MAG: hypothetical protein J3Q66DRAFT_335283 [Benniella sp.]